MCSMFLCCVAGEVNVQLSQLNRQMSSDKGNCFKYYFFRCEVSNSLRLVWKAFEVEIRRFGSTSQPNTFVTEDVYHLLLSNIIPGDEPSAMYYLSYMWFNQEHLQGVMNVTCESDNNEENITVEKYGNKLIE